MISSHDAARKIAFIDELRLTCLTKIEAISLSLPQYIPSLADAHEVMESMAFAPGVEYTVLEPNERGCARALALHVVEINPVLAGSMAFRVLLEVPPHSA